VFDIEIQRCTRRCAATGQELSAGEEFYSVLVPDGKEIQRQDYSITAWGEPPDNAIACWKSRMPDPAANRLNWAPNDVIRHYFEELGKNGDPQHQDTRYVLTLLMIRRRIVRLEEVDRQHKDRQKLVVYCPKNETEYQVPVMEPTPERIVEIQDELAKLLFAETA